MSTRTLVAAFAATTLLAAGAALAAPDQTSGTTGGAGSNSTIPPGHKAAMQDFRKLSSDGVRGYQDLSLARLAIFDGRVADAKKLVADADNAFNKAKSDNSVFTKAEADMRTQMKHPGGAASGTQTSAASQTPSNTDAGKGSAETANSQADQDVHKPVAWLPVDETVTLNEDYTMQPAKAKAVADANKSLAKGDRNGAMDKLRLAGVDLDVGLAVVPLQKTLDDVGQAEQLVNSGKFYEGSQKLRAVQDSTVLTMADMSGDPAKGGTQKSGAGTQPSTDQGASATTNQAPPKK